MFDCCSFADRTQIYFRRQEVGEGVMNRKNGRVDLLIWSGLNFVTKMSGGRFTLVDHFNSKAAVTEHVRNSGLPFVHVQAGFYASNFTGRFQAS